MTPRTRIRADADLIEEVHDLAIRNRATPAQIHSALLQRHGAERVPSLRTIQRAVTEITAADDSTPWALAPTPPTTRDAAPLVEALAEVIVLTEGRIAQLTNAEAAWIVSIHAAAPDLSPWRTYRLARAYVARAARGGGTDDLDAWLAIAPWRSDAAATDYELAVARGLRRAPMVIEVTPPKARMDALQGAAIRRLLETDPTATEHRYLLNRLADTWDPAHEEFEELLLDETVRGFAREFLAQLLESKAKVQTKPRRERRTKP